MLVLPDHYPETLANLAALLHDRLASRLPADQAAAVAFDLTEAIRQQFGGELLYIPKGDACARYQRNAQILRQFNGRNHADLARRHGLSVTKIYEVLAAGRAANQAQLFEAKD